MALEGTLQDMSLSDLIQVFRMGPKSGVLLIVYADERGVIYVAHGTMIDAVIVQTSNRAIHATGEEAVIQMLTWDNGSFVFSANPSVFERPVRIVRDGEELILEGLRRRKDPAQALPYHTITLDTRLQLSPLPNKPENGVSLDVNQWRVLSQVASDKDLREICAVTCLGSETVIRTVAELLSLGLVEIAPTNRLSASRSTTQTARKPHHPQPILASANAGCSQNSSDQPQPVVGSSLINAIMRRIRIL